jgi:hypothetical protein
MTMTMSQHRNREPALPSLAWLGAVTIFALGCGDNDADANEAVPQPVEQSVVVAVDPCSLLTAGEVAEVLGVQVEAQDAPATAASFGFDGCNYTGGGILPVVFLGVRGLGVPLTPDFYRDLQAGWREDMLSLGAEYVEPEYVEGLGTAAIWREDELNFGLHAVARGYEVMLNTFENRDETPLNKQRGIVLMEKALSRLP